MSLVDNGQSSIIDELVGDAVLAAMDQETGKARGLPNEAFTDPAFLALERKHVFSRTWVFAGMASDTPQPGDIMPREVGGRALIMVRDGNNDLRVFHNVCPHRGARLIIDSCNAAKAMTCPYHAWSFELSGALKGRPHFHGPGLHEKNSGQNDVGLFEVRSAEWNDWIFINLDGQAPAFEEYMGPAFARLQSWNLSAFKQAHYQPYEFHCNWKLAIENFCDNYHVFKVHPALHDMQTATDRFPMEPHGAHMFNWFIIGGEGRGLTVDPDGPLLPEVPNLPDELKKSSPYCSLFPNVTMAVFPSNLQFFMFEPVAVDRTIMHVWFYFVGDAAAAPEHSVAREKVVAEWTHLNAEDSGICQRLQEGRSCDAYDGGRFAPYWDIGTVHFHRQIAQSVRGIGAYAR